jgi:acetylornithine deacetylase/succinyl-diaminopimelate desuccinylase-like protein
MDVRGYVESNASEFLDALKQWLAIPSISADPARRPDIERSAQWLAAYLSETGFPTVEVWEPSAVFAEWPAADPAAPKVLVYGHHDVQPVEPLDEWTSPPFEPAEVDGKLLARGVSDDKGQVLFHTLGIRAYLAANDQTAPPVTVKLLIEGEEESGSTHFADLLRHNQQRLAADVIVVSDATMWSPDVPSMCVGMRGLADAEVTISGPTRDLHSGSFGGGVPNPLHAMASLLAGLHDAGNRVTIPGFYDRVVELADQEREMFGRLPFDENEWLADAGDSGAAYGEQGFTTLERIWARPTAEVNGMWGGHTGIGGKTIIPREAHAKITFRLVANQDPKEIAEAFREYVRANTPPGLKVTVTSRAGVRPSRSPIDSPAVRAGPRAMQRAFGSEILFTKEGGSGPEADLNEILGAPLVFIGTGTDADRMHAPNEQIDISRLLRGAEVCGYLWEEMAAISTDLR